MWRVNVVIVVFWDFLKLKAYVWRNIMHTVVTIQGEGLTY